MTIGMKYLGVFLHLAAILVLISCNSSRPAFRIGKRVVSPTEGVPVMAISPQEMITGECLEGVLGICCIRDSIAVFSLLQEASPSCYRALRLSDMTFVDFLRKGRGPEEVVNAFYSGVRNENGRTVLDLTAANDNLLLSLDLNSTIEQGNAVILAEYEVPSGTFNSWVVGDRVLGEIVFDEDYYSLKYYDKRDMSLLRTVKWFGDDDYLESFYPLYGSSIGVKPDGTRLSLGMLFFDERNIVDLEGENHLSISTAQECRDEAILKRTIREERFVQEYYYYSSDVTDRFIYALYLNGEGIDRQPPYSIHVFTWDGKLSAIYQVDERLVGIAVSEDDSTLYGLTEEEELYRYSITSSCVIVD